MFELDSATGILSGVSVALSLLSIWMCQAVGRRLDAVSAEMITDHLTARNDAEMLKKEIETLRRESVGRAHWLEQRARDSLH